MVQTPKIQIPKNIVRQLIWMAEIKERLDFKDVDANDPRTVKFRDSLKELTPQFLPLLRLLARAGILVVDIVVDDPSEVAPHSVITVNSIAVNASNAFVVDADANISLLSHLDDARIEPYNPDRLDDIILSDDIEV